MYFIFPFTYFFKTRAKTFLHRASFFVFIVFPIAALYSDEINYNITSINVFIFLLGFIGMFSVYEIGYIYNDFYTTKFEEKPSYWISADDFNSVKKRILLIISSRVFLLFACCVCLRNICSFSIVPYLSVITVLYLTYSVHNSFRGRITIATNFVLQVCKYGAVLFLYQSIVISLYYSMLMIFVAPLLRAIEFMHKDRFDICVFKKIDISKLRVIYYAIGSITSVFFMRARVKGSKMLFLIMLFLLIYRITSYFMLKNSKIMSIRMQNFKDVK